MTANIGRLLIVAGALVVLAAAPALADVDGEHPWDADELGGVADDERTVTDEHPWDNQEIDTGLDGEEDPWDVDEGPWDADLTGTLSPEDLLAVVPLLVLP